MSNTSIREQTWVIIPAYNEAKYIHRVLNKVAKITKNIVVIDDGSKDSTYEQAQACIKQVVRHPINLGKGAALKTGCELVFGRLNGQAVIFLDGDDQHNPDELELFFQQLELGQQMIFGERSMDHEMPLARIIGNRITSFLVLIFFGRYIPDIPSGFKAITKSAYQKIKWSATDYSVEMEIAARVAKLKMPFTVIPIATIYHDLERGMNIIDVVKMSISILLWRFGL